MDGENRRFQRISSEFNTKIKQLKEKLIETEVMYETLEKQNKHLSKQSLHLLPQQSKTQN